MKKLALVVSIVAALGSVSAVQAASTGTITFNGLLTATTCDAAVAGQAADAVVTLPTVGIAELATDGDKTGLTGFNIALSNCAGTLKTVKAFFQAGSYVNPTTGRLINTGTAGNVSVALVDGTTNQDIFAGDTAQLAGTAGFVTYDATGNATLPYAAQYYAEDATTAGTVIAKVIYNLQYK